LEALNTVAAKALALQPLLPGAGGFGGFNPSAVFTTGNFPHHRGILEKHAK